MKTWTKPELIVLVRSQPEEAVLDNCKSDSIAGGNPTSIQNSCHGSDGPPNGEGCYALQLS